MTSSIPAARRVGAIQRHLAPAGHTLHENGGIRTGWWWQDGPVNTCCGCCSLRAGVGLLAASDLVIGLITLYVLIPIYDVMFDSSLDSLKSEYSRDCANHVASTASCQELVEAIKELEGSFSLYFVLLQVQGLICVVAGAIGLSAVSSGNAEAARVFMLAWPANFSLGLFMMLKRKWSARGDPAEAGEGYRLLIVAVHSVFLVYYFKVSWSYYKRRLDHEEKGAHSSLISWNAMHQEQPMTTMHVA